METKESIRCWQVGAGPRSMLQSAKKMKQRGAFLVLRSLSADIRWVFETSSLDRSVEIHSSSVEAIAAVINWRAIKFETPMKVTETIIDVPCPEGLAPDGGDRLGQHLLINDNWWACLKSRRPVSEHFRKPVRGPR